MRFRGIRVPLPCSVGKFCFQDLADLETICGGGGEETFFACDETSRSYAVVIGVDVEKNCTLAGEKSNRLGVDLIDVRVRQILCLIRQFKSKYFEVLVPW